jgi:F-type H+-transporting ATPase subunit gamma
MPSLKQLRRRLRTVSSTKLITRAMRSVAASKMRKTQDRRQSAKPYVERLQSLVAHVLESASLEGQPLLEKREGGKRLFLVFSSDRGLCGAFNATVCRFAEEVYNQAGDAQSAMYIIGRRAVSYFKKRQVNIVGVNTEFSGNVDTAMILKVSQEIQKLFLEGRFNSVEIIYNQAITAMAYRPRHDVLLPLQRDQLLASLGEKTEKDESRAAVEYIFEPDAQTLLSELLPKFVETKILFTFIDAFAAEHQARMMAMTTANQNCMELMDALTLQLNKARQSTITKELLEIVGGAEALKG